MNDASLKPLVEGLFALKKDYYDRLRASDKLK